jgi:hypothetical protein
MVRRLLVSILVVGALLLAACGDDAGDDTGTSATGNTSPPVTGPEADALEQAVRAYSAAFLAGDTVAVRALQSARCQEAIPDDGLAAAVAGANAAYADAQIEELRVLTITGDAGRVSYTYSDPVINQTDEPWIREGGAWRMDDCPTP